jgi:hypothetical protein
LGVYLTLEYLAIYKATNIKQFEKYLSAQNHGKLNHKRLERISVAKVNNNRNSRGPTKRYLLEDCCSFIY